MGFLYGNISNHLPRTHFQFEKIYPSRIAMHTEVEEIPENIEEDVEFGLNVYFLVDYSSGDKSYTENQQDDINAYGIGNFDYTVWQSQYIDEHIRCVAKARLHSVLPTFETLGSYQIDILEPISGADFFGRGKNIWGIETIVNAQDQTTNVNLIPTEDRE